MNSLEFFIYKYSYTFGDNININSIPMMLKRKLSPVGKIAMHTLLECYQSGEPEFVYASRYGELERVVKLIKQQKEENEVSPTGFSFSVHNSTVGLFSLINKIHTGYNSVAAGENTFSNGLLAAILNKKETLFCFAESIDRYESCSLLIGPDFRKNSIHVICESNNNKIKSNSFYDFLEGKTTIYAAPDFIIRRLND